MKTPEHLIRPNIRALADRRSAVERIGGKDLLRLDTNESPFNSPFNRYPTDYDELKSAISRHLSIRTDCIFLTNGTHEAVDLLLRLFCVPQTDNIITLSPTADIYADAAMLNDVPVRKVCLDAKFGITAEKVLAAADPNTKLIFICSPNNPTGNLLDRKEILKTADSFDGMLVVDEAYIHFASTASIVTELSRHPNIIVLRTFSKAIASAGIRLGVVYALPWVIRYLDRMTPPFRIGTPTLREAISMTRRLYDVDKWVRLLLDEREKVMNAFRLLPYCEKVYPSDASFFLARMKKSEQVYNYLLSQGIVVGNCGTQEMCEGCLRVSVGSTVENSRLLSALRKYNPE